MAHIITIGSGKLVAEIMPELGGGLSRFDCDATPLFRPWNGDPNPLNLASIVLVPWSNRMSGGGFEFDETFYPIDPNVQGEKYPLHGSGFQNPWDVLAVTDNSAELVLRSTAPRPYDYESRLRYVLSANEMLMELAVTNRGGTRLPFGLGFHPRLVRTPHTTLTASFPRVWLETSEHLPDRLVAINSRSQWDFRRPSALPDDWINNAFPDWDGHAVVNWPEHELTLAIDASEDLSCAIVYSPSGEADFFCLEPVTHPVDAFRLDGGAKANGMRVLATGETQTVSCRYSVV